MQINHQRFCDACTLFIDPMERRIQTDAITDYHVSCYSRMKKDNTLQFASTLTASSCSVHEVVSLTARKTWVPVTKTQLACNFGTCHLLETACPNTHEAWQTPGPPTQSGGLRAAGTPDFL